MTLLGILTANRELSGAIRAAAVGLIAALTAAAAQVSVQLPFTPVPFTLQPMVVLLGGAALGPRLGLASQALYLLAGIAGLPVFAYLYYRALTSGWRYVHVNRLGAQDLTGASAGRADHT